jgi:anti-sigma factor RsiW
VNRSLTEGRKRFFDRFARIESGERCDGFRPLLSAACDGEASSEDEHMLAAHLRGCQTCRAAVRAYRAAPARLAELLPPGIVAPLRAHRSGWWTRLYESFVAGSGDRAGALGYKLQQAGELFSAQKATAVVASTAALAGGAAVHENRVHHHHGRSHAVVRAASSIDSESAPAVAPGPAPTPAPAADTETRAQEQPSPESAGEFTPEAAVESNPPPQPETTEFAPAASTSSSGGSAGASSEFGP